MLSRVTVPGGFFYDESSEEDGIERRFLDDLLG
jgi:hypothetical protein